MLKDLTYKVIVIDDEVDLYEDYTDFIQAKLDQEGYILIHERYEELSDLDENPIDDVDLFLIDLKFGKVDKGPEFIRKIRENYLTDILFYSSDTQAIRNNRTSGEYQGVYFAIRDENKKAILDMIGSLIDKMIKRSNTPLSSRGIVLGCVAELDNIIKEKVASLIAYIQSEDQKALIDNCTKQYYESYKGQSKKINEFFSCDFHRGMREWSEVKAENINYELNELVNSVKITDSSKNLQVLLKIYKTWKCKDEKYSAVATCSDLLDDRNVLAHVQEELNSEGYYQFKRLKDDDYLILTEDNCRELRKSIINYCTIINEIDK